MVLVFVCGIELLMLWMGECFDFDILYCGECWWCMVDECVMVLVVKL